MPVPPGKAVRVAGYAIEGKMDVTWKGKVRSYSAALNCLFCGSLT